MRTKLLFPMLPLTVALALGAAPAVGAEISPKAAANMANNCFACHGPEGRSPGTMPSLHQLTAKNMAALLRQFRTGERPSTVMGRHAKGYSDAEIDALAEYIAGLQK
jgi:cytochrome subunit of sulfide dehydrogenase